MVFARIFFDKNNISRGLVRAWDGQLVAIEGGVAVNLGGLDHLQTSLRYHERYLHPLSEGEARVAFLLFATRFIRGGYTEDVEKLEVLYRSIPGVFGNSERASYSRNAVPTPNGYVPRAMRPSGRPSTCGRIP